MIETNEHSNARRVKSRSGCKACKARRIKCDETTPSCRQCIKRKAQCPGYLQVFTWSRRHELPREGRGTPLVWPSLSRGRSSAGPSAATSCRQTLQIDSALKHTPIPTVSSTPWPRCDLSGQMPELDESTSTTSHHILNKKNPPSPSPPSSIDVDVVTILPSDIYAGGKSLQMHRASCLEPEKPSPIVERRLYSTAFELHYFGQNICQRLLLCDAAFNPIRNITIDKVRSSALYSALLRYLIAEFRDETCNTHSAQHLLQIARADTEALLAKSNRQEDYDPSEVLLAMIMFGMSTSWNGTNETGIQFYQKAVAMYESFNSTMPCQEQDFYHQTLVYWWSGLAFVANRSKDGLLDPPRITISSSPSDIPNPQSINPNQNSTKLYNFPLSFHPLTGVSLLPFELLGKVGALVYAQRTLSLGCLFVNDAKVEAQKDMLRESCRLERALQDLKFPYTNQGADCYDVQTPAEDLCHVAEALRLCALLLLYRCFPDLLRGKLVSLVTVTPSSMESYMREAALHALGVIEKNSIRSRTRSVEQLLLIIISEELKFPAEPDATNDEASNFHAEELSEGSTRSRNDFFGPVDPDVQRDATPRCMYVVNGRDRILGARALLCTRMSAVRDHLPYKSVEQAENLIWNIWRASDSGHPMFWMDLMIRNKKRFVMI